MASEEDKDPEKEHRTLVRQLLNERTTESGRACIEAAAYCLDIGELAEARQWIKLALDADKAHADIRIHRALEEFERPNIGAAHLGLTLWCVRSLVPERQLSAWSSGAAFTSARRLEARA